MSANSQHSDDPNGYLVLAPAPGDPTIALPLHPLPIAQEDQQAVPKAPVRVSQSSGSAMPAETAPAFAAAELSQAASPKTSPPAKTRRHGSPIQGSHSWPIPPVPIALAFAAADPPRAALPRSSIESAIVQETSQEVSQEEDSSESAGVSVHETVVQETAEVRSGPRSVVKRTRLKQTKRSRFSPDVRPKASRPPRSEPLYKTPHLLIAPLSLTRQLWSKRTIPQFFASFSNQQSMPKNKNDNFGNDKCPRSLVECRNSNFRTPK